MGIEDIGKTRTGEGSALVNNFKDLFPDRISTLYIYKGKNLVSQDENIFSQEDYHTIISLELVASIPGIFGGEVFKNLPTTVEEEKQIKKIKLENTSTASFTAFVQDIKDAQLDLTQNDLFYTIGKPFEQKDINVENNDVFSQDQLIPGIFQKLLPGVQQLSDTQKELADQQIYSWTLIPAAKQNNLPSSKVVFASVDIYKPLPINETDFEITSIELEADQSFMPEYGNWIQAFCKIETKTNQIQETPIDLKMNKPLAPLQVAPYAKNKKIQFALLNFNNFLRMPWLYAKQFLGNDKSIKSYILQGSSEKWATDLADAVVNMFKLSHAFSTNFSEYRDANGDIKNEKIGEVSLKSLEGKEGNEWRFVDGILKSWEYQNGTKKKTQEYIRALQILYASGEWINSSFCAGKGLNEFHKITLDWYLDLDSTINKVTTDINMDLNSLRYDFKQADPNDSLSPFQPNLKPLLDASKVIVDKLDRYTSIPELDDPISLETFVSFAGDINTKSQDSLKYMVGIDITDPAKLAEFLIDTDRTTTTVVSKQTSIDTDYYSDGLKIGTAVSSPTAIGIPAGTTYNGVPVQNTPSSIEDFIKQSSAIPTDAYDIQIISQGTKQSLTVDYDLIVSNGAPFPVTLFRNVGAIVSYKVRAVSHGTLNKVFTYDKGTYLNMITNFSDDIVFKRDLSISDDFRDDTGNSIIKIKQIDNIFISALLGTYVQLKINYRYKDTNNAIINEFLTLPKIILPSNTDETRSKIGIKL